MEHTDLALAAQRSGSEDAKALFMAAFDFERQAAIMIAPRLDAEPTRSVLHRNARSQPRSQPYPSGHSPGNVSI